MKNNDITTHFMGYKIVSTTKDQVLKILFSQITEGVKIKTVCTPNPEQLVFAKSHSWFEKALGKSDILLPDGIGISIGSQVMSAFGKGKPIMNRIAGVDVVSELLAQFPDKKFLIIGGRDYAGCHYLGWKVFEKAEITKKKDISKENRRAGQGKQTLFWQESFLNVTQPTQREKQALETAILSIKPDVVFVAFGAPQQEKWMLENKDFLQGAGVRLVMVVGGAFDMLFGKVPRAPKWMQQVGLEWLFRLYQEPWRWRRQINLLVFLKMVIQEALN